MEVAGVLADGSFRGSRRPCLETEAQLAEVNVALLADTRPGDSVRMVGSATELGCWDPYLGAELRTDSYSYPRWSGSVRLLATACSAGVEYKFVVLQSNGDVRWEQGCNRCFYLHPDDRSGVEHLRSEGMCRRGTRVFDELWESAANAEAPRFGEAMHEPLKARLVPFPRLACDSDPAIASAKPSMANKEGSAPAMQMVRPESDSTLEPAESQLSETPSVASLLEASALAPSSPRSEFWAGASKLQKPGGPCEDAYFLSENALGVADGVSHMAEFAHYGVDAAAYAAELMELSAASFTRSPQGPSTGSSRAPIASRSQAAIATAEASATTFGASTITVLTLDGSIAGVANLGDSGFKLLRRRAWGMEIIKESREQSHGWNCPYQLTRVPEALHHLLPSTRLDSAADADTYQVQVCHGDLLLLYTDGLSDNLYSYEVVSIIDDLLKRASAQDTEPTVAPTQLAKVLVDAAYHRSLDKEALTPFARNAKRHRLDFPGGKPDDITVVAAWVHVTSSAEDT